MNLASYIAMKGGSLTTYRKRGRQKGFSVSVNTNKSFLCTCFTPMVLQLEKRAHFQTEILRCIQFVREPDGEGVSLSWSTVAMHQVPTKPQIPKQVVIDEFPPPMYQYNVWLIRNKPSRIVSHAFVTRPSLTECRDRDQPAYAV